jgi:hypothetical protein
LTVRERHVSDADVEGSLAYTSGVDRRIFHPRPAISQLLQVVDEIVREELVETMKLTRVQSGIRGV